jgi:hypothetical protein
MSRHLLASLMKNMRNLMGCLLFLIIGNAFSYDVSTNVNVVDTITLNLNIPGNTVPFNAITYATIGSPNTLSYSSVSAYTNNSVNTVILMTSDAPADASNNPQLKDTSIPANYIPYTVSFQPCYKPASQPVPNTYLLKVGQSQIIPMPYSLFSACFVPGGGKLGTITFTRLPLANLPTAGNYKGVLSFILSET